MAITSVGYDGSVDEVQWAEMIKKVGSADYGVVTQPAWKVTGVPAADRTVSVAAGKGWGHGVFDTLDVNTTIQLDTVASGVRWDLVAMRRDWTGTGGVTSIVKVNGTAAKVIPTGRVSGPGVIDDQPLALVQVTAGQTQPTAIVDLRCFAGNGGMAANDVLALTYLKSIAADCIIQGKTWRCFATSLGELYWVDEYARGVATPIPPNSASWLVLQAPTAWTCSGGDFIHVSGQMTYSGSSLPAEGWVLATLPAGMRPQSAHLIMGTGNTGASAQTFYVTPSGAITLGEKPVGRQFLFNGIFPL